MADIWPGCRRKPRAHLLHQQALQLTLTVLHALAVGTVHHPDQAICALKVVPPVGAQRLLATHIPDVQFESGKEGAMKVRLVLSPLPSPSPTWPPVTLFTPSPTWPSATLLTPGLFPQPHVALSHPTHPRVTLLTPRVTILTPGVLGF